MFPESKISSLTIDQGREYLSTKQINWYKSKGIQVETTVAYTPQQNGVSERFNRTVFDKLRSMISESHVPKCLWNEAALSAVYIINRCPTKAIEDDATPASLWYRNKIDLRKIKTVGCKAYYWIPDCKRKKLDSKGKIMMQPQAKENDELSAVSDSNHINDVTITDAIDADASHNQHIEENLPAAQDGEYVEENSSSTQDLPEGGTGEEVPYSANEPRRSSRISRLPSQIFAIMCRIFRQFQQSPNDTHWQHLKRVVDYIGTMTMKLNFHDDYNEPIIGYADADWASDKSDRKSKRFHISSLWLYSFLVQQKTTNRCYIIIRS
ncbi:Copia protein [Eumeta japonica]|uniref:Copia protein n=1 Tax=Eumeta variegata TaxID=151549 RepID=A0A4C1T0G7_EUMVA|nr:Copia protein [Eumeta japonica]